MGNQQVDYLGEFNNIFNSPSPNELHKRIQSFCNQKIQQQFLENLKNDTIKLIIKENTKNFILFMHSIIDYLHMLAERVDRAIQNNLEVNSINNAVQLLTKIIPCLHEQEYSNIYRSLFWNYDEQEIRKIKQNNQLLMISNKQKKNDNEKEINLNKVKFTCYGLKLIDALQILCFYKNYTIFTKDGIIVWQTLIDIPEKCPNNNEKYYANRIIILQCMLSLLGSSLYQYNNANNYQNPWALYLISPKNLINQEFIQSLLYFSLRFKESNLQFYKELFISTRYDNELACVSIQVLLILLSINTSNIDKFIIDFKQQIDLQYIFDFFMPNSQINSQQSLNHENSKTEIQSVFQNNATKFISSIKSQNQYEYLLNYFIALLENHIKYDQHFFPESFEKINFNQELLGIFQQFIQINQNFLEFVCLSPLLNRVFKILMFNFCTCIEYQQNQEYFLMTVIAITQFSLNRNFSSYLNRDLDFNFQMINFPVISGKFSDFLICTIATCILTGFEQKKNFFPYNLLSILLNVSSYLKGLTQISSNKLLQILQICTNYEFLFQSNYHPQCLQKILIIIDNIIQHQLEHNAELLIELIKKQNVIARIPKIYIDEKAAKVFFMHKVKQNNNQNQLINCQNSTTQQSPQKEIAQIQQQSKEQEQQNPIYQKEMQKSNNQQDQQKLQQEQYEEEQKDQVSNNQQKVIIIQPQVLTPEQQQAEIFSQQWKGFNSKYFKQTLQLQNIQLVIKRINEFLIKNNKTCINEDDIKQLIDNNSFIGILKRNQNLFIENFTDQNILNQLFSQFTWTKILQRSVLMPFFDPQQILYFIIQIPEIKNQQQNIDNSLNVEPPSTFLNSGIDDQK